MIKSIILILLTIVSVSAFGTGQVPDYLIIKNDTFPIFTNPLEQYFDQVGKRELTDFRGCGSTACWRGYKAIWELENDSLFLKAITSCHDHCSPIKDANLEAMFGSNRVFANWFYGELIIPKGELVKYIHMGYASIYERELHLKFQYGVKTGEMIKSNEKIVNEIKLREKTRQISKLAQDTIFFYVQKNIDWDYLESNTELMCDDEYILTFSKKGKIKSVIIEPYGDTKWEIWWFGILDLPCRRKIKKALRKLDLSYLDIPRSNFDIRFEIFYNTETNKLEHWKEFWMEYDKKLLQIE